MKTSEGSKHGFTLTLALPNNVLNITFVNIKFPTLSYECYVVAILIEHVPLASCSMKTGIMSLVFNALPLEPGKQQLIEDSQVPIGICVIKLSSNSFFFKKK